MSEAVATPEACSAGGGRVALINLGCRVNRVEIDMMAAELERAGCTICDAEEAQVVVINTCAVTGEAETKTRKALRRATRLPLHPAVIATGCVANLLGGRLQESVRGIVIETSKRDVAARCLELLGRQGAGTASASPGQLKEVGGTQLVAPTPTGRTRPGIKIQDGCDNRCSFCIVWKARGHSRSRAVQDIVHDVAAACERGAHEVVLTGINLGNYRSDGGPVRAGGRLEDLLEHLLCATEIDRIRLSSIEPPDVTDSLLQTMAASHGRIAPFLHVCLQSGCDATLRRMGRVYDTAYFADMVTRARDAVADIAIGTDLIVGFPQETEEEFEASYGFCKEVGFTRMHVFRYSQRPGTPAASMTGQVDAAVKALRAKRVISLAQDMRLRHMAREVGKQDLVVVQAPGKAVTSRLFDAILDDTVPVGSYVPVRYSGVKDGVLVCAPCERPHTAAAQ